MRLILLRHGVTYGNLKRIVQGHIDGKLTPDGIEQAEKAGLWLSEENIDIIYVSDLKRAGDTATIIADHHPDADLIVTDRIRERNWGELEGKPYEDISKAFRQTTMPTDRYKPKGGESREEFVIRGNTFFDGLYEKHHDKTVLVVTHGGLITNFLLRLMHLDFKNRLVVAPDNTAITVIEFDDTKSYQIKILNSTSHLDIEI